MESTPTEGSVTIFAALGDQPMFVGRQPENRGITCECGRDLAVAVSSESFWDVAFRCKCEKLTTSPLLPNDHPLPPGRTMVFENSVYNISTVDLPIGFVIASVTARQRYDHRIRAILDVAPSSTAFATDSLLDLVDDVRRLVGSEFDSAQARHQRGRASATPPKHVSRLMRLVTSVLRSAEQLRGKPSQLTVPPVLELIAFRDLVSRWRGDPIFRSVESSLLYDYPHALITLTVADHLIRAGNAILMPSPQAGRSPDLAIYVGAGEHVPLEVKVPRALWHPPSELAPGVADSLVESALKKAGTGGNGQLRGGISSLLVLGGFNVGERVMHQLKGAAERHLRKKLPGREHLGALSIVSVTGVARNVRETTEGIVSRANTQLNPGYVIEIVNNPFAARQLLDTSPRPNERLTALANHREISLRGDGED